MLFFCNVWNMKYLKLILLALSVTLVVNNVNASQKLLEDISTVDLESNINATNIIPNNSKLNNYLLSNNGMLCDYTSVDSNSSQAIILKLPRNINNTSQSTSNSSSNNSSARNQNIHEEALPDFNKTPIATEQIVRYKPKMKLSLDSSTNNDKIKKMIQPTFGNISNVETVNNSNINAKMDNIALSNITINKFINTINSNYNGFDYEYLMKFYNVLNEIFRPGVSINSKIKYPQIFKQVNIIKGMKIINKSDFLNQLLSSNLKKQDETIMSKYITNNCSTEVENDVNIGNMDLNQTINITIPC